LEFTLQGAISHLVIEKIDKPFARIAVRDVVFGLVIFARFALNRAWIGEYKITDRAFHQLEYFLRYCVIFAIQEGLKICFLANRAM
jgi:hypothetical protein